jgi:hypothetical protein
MTILFPHDKIAQLYTESAKQQLSTGKFIRKIVLDFLNGDLKYSETQYVGQYINPPKIVRHFPCPLVKTLEPFDWDEYYNGLPKLYSAFNYVKPENSNS